MNGTMTLIFKKKELINELTSLFIQNAKTFKGLYGGFYLISIEKNKTPLKVLNEFYQRISFIPNSNEVCSLLTPVLFRDKISDKSLQKLIVIIFLAMDKANIHGSAVNSVLKLTSKNVLHYQDWSGEKLYVDDQIRVYSPAWYQNGVLIEEGVCTIVSN